MDMTDDPAPRYKHAGVNRPKTLAFPNFKLSTRFQNNFCLLMDKSKKKSPQVFVLTDILKHVQGNCRYRLIGQKFIKLEDAFEEPFKSSEFQIYIASQISSTTFECDENMILSRIASAFRGYNYLGEKNTQLVKSNRTLYLGRHYSTSSKLNSSNLTVSTVRGSREFIVRADHISVRWSWTGEPRCPFRSHWSRPVQINWSCPVQFTWSGHVFVPVRPLQGRRPVQEASETDPSVTISAKMYPFPINLNCPFDVNSRTQKWFFSKLHHTMPKFKLTQKCKLNNTSSFKLHLFNSAMGQYLIN